MRKERSNMRPSWKGRMGFMTWYLVARDGALQFHMGGGGKPRKDWSRRGIPVGSLVYGYSTTFFILSSVDRYLGCFYLLFIVNSTVMNSHRLVFVWTPIFSSLGYIYLGVELLGLMMVLFLVFWEASTLTFSQWLHQITFPPTVKDSLWTEPNFEWLT